MSQPIPPTGITDSVPSTAPPSTAPPADAPPWYARISTDWWATILAGALAGLAVANLLPKIPW